MTERETLQQVYIRVCCDSGFQLDLHRACALAANIVGKHPMDIWMAMPSLDVMFEIAAGTHPAARKVIEARQGRDLLGSVYESAGPEGMRQTLPSKDTKDTPPHD